MSQNANEFNFKLTGKGGLAGGAVAVVAGLLIAIRAMTLGESDDERLRTAVKAELHNTMGGAAQAELEKLDTDDPEAVAAFIETVDAEKIEVHSTRVSMPLLSMSSNEDAIVRVEYTLPGGSRTTEYWRMRRMTGGNWQYRGRGSAVSYYLNFL